MFSNVGPTDRILRIVAGAAMGIAGILTIGHPIVGRLLGVTGALIILSGACGT
jgi:Inner membrane protein YgaP-like, transmembrane domain